MKNNLKRMSPDGAFNLISAVKALLKGLYKEASQDEEVL